MSLIRKVTLHNGIKLITEEMPDVESSSIGVWVANGSRDEATAERGISHFIEHLLFKGTKKRTALKISSDIESVGGVMNAFTGREYTCYYIKVLNKDIPLAIDILSDIFKNSLFDSRELEKERLVILQEIKMVDDTPDDLVHDLFTERFWKGQALGSPVLGTAATVSSFKRKTVVDYFSRRYRPGSVLITAAGGILHKNMVKLVNKGFGGIAAGSAHEKEHRPVHHAGAMLVKRKLEQVHLCIGVPAPAQSHHSRYAAYLANTIIGGGMSSRLFQEIREKRGLAYSVYSYLNLMRDAGSLVVYAGTSKKDFSKVAGLILKEFSGFSRTVKPSELKAAKEQLKGGLLLGLETSDARMTKLARDEMYFKRDIPVREIVAAIDAVTLGDVKALARSIFEAAPVTMVAVGEVSAKGLPARIEVDA